MASCGTITVEPAFDPSDVSVSCEGVPGQAVVGEEIPVSYTVTNGGSATAETTVAFRVNGDTLTETTETAAPGVSIGFKVNWTPEEAGSYTPEAVVTDAREA
jgi:subtilase family serine protease